MEQAQHKKTKKFAEDFMAALCEHPDGPLKSKAIQVMTEVGQVEWNRRLSEVESFLKGKREENIQLIGAVAGPQAEAEIRLLLETDQNHWAYVYPASDVFRALTGSSEVLVTCSHGFLSVHGNAT